MTEKRFEYVYLYELGVNAIKDNVTGKHTPLSDKIADKLNELNDENQELHIQNDFLKNENKHMRTVINENMQLKKLLRKISNCNGEIWLSNGRIIRLKKIFKGEWIND